MIKGSYLSHEGYNIPKKNITDEQYKLIKKELTVVPLNNGYGDDNEENTKYKVYKVEDGIIKIPRYYGIENFGVPKKSLYDPEKVKIKFTGELRDYQINIVETCLKHMREHGGGLLSLPCGMGKCLAKDTPILMFDGTIKKVQDVKIGNILMGDDSQPRTVFTLARGREEMFDIIPTKGEKYTVNRSHILSLKWGTIEKGKINGVIYTKNDIMDISVDDYLKLPKMYNNSRGSPLRGFRVPINFLKTDVPIDPYFLGLWLGDGNKKRIYITNIDDVIICYVKNYAKKMGAIITQHEHDSITYNVVRKNVNDKNATLEEFKKLNLLNNKHIPHIYKCNSSSVRFQVLAGLIDTDGSLTDCKRGFEITQKSEKLADDIVYLCRSLGFSCYKKKCIKRCTNSKNPNHAGTYYRMTIYGDDIENVPVKLVRKKALKRRQIKNVLNYMITVKSIGIGDYYGFEIDGNGRFVMGDFSVTHNTCLGIYIAAQLNVKTLVLTHKTFLQEQWIARVKQFTKSDVGIIRQKKVDVDEKDFVIAMIQSLSKRDYDTKIFEQFGLVICDESHHFAARMFSQGIAKAGCKYTLSLSATPYRADGLIKIVNWYLGNVMYKQSLKVNNSVVTKIITFISTDKLFKEKRRYINGSIKPNSVLMISNLLEIESRNKHIINIIDQLRKDPNRKVLVLSERKNHLKLLKKEVDKLIQLDVDANIILENECKTYFYTGDCKRQERYECEQYCDIAFATYQMASEGLDIDRLNCVLLASPKKDINQSVGRILRKDTGVRPLVIDIVDNLSMFKSQALKRQKFYKDSKYLQHFYYMSNDEIISPYEYLKLIHDPNEDANQNAPRNFADMLEVPIEIMECVKNEEESDEKDKKPKKIKKHKDPTSIRMF
jgi:superfamily II DNA or RNA helicase